ncbi:MAG: TraB/GumN family protein [Hyphomicrobiaceae bacterium]
MAELARRDPLAHRRIIQRAVATANSQAVFWQIDRAGRTPSYLLGTVHLTDERLKRLPQAVDRALQQARQVAVETYYDREETAESVLSQLGTAAVSSPAHRLSDHLSEQEFAELERFAGEARISRDELDRLNPWVAEMLIRGETCEARRVERGELVLDAWIASRAAGDGIPLRKLETVSEQFGTLASIPYSAQLAMLRYALSAKSGTADDEIETMVGLYLRRQIPAIDAMTRMLAPEPEMARAYLDAFWTDLIGRRNERFVANAQPLIEDGGAFIAVGAAHLPGERGMVAMLRQAGYTVTAVESGSATATGLSALAKPSQRKRKSRRKATTVAEAVPRAAVTGYRPERTGGRK